jgi:hypothetical protein
VLAAVAAAAAVLHGACRGTKAAAMAYLVDAASRRATLVFASVGDFWG